MSQTFSEFVIVYCDLARHVWYQKIIINEIFKVSANLWKQANGLFLSMYDRFQKLLKLRQKGFWGDPNYLEQYVFIQKGENWPRLKINSLVRVHRNLLIQLEKCEQDRHDNCGSPHQFEIMEKRVISQTS